MTNNNYIIFNCPHCNLPVQVYMKELNCHIFRHGIMKDTLKQIEPHLNKSECDRLYNNNLIYGCGKPFQLVKNNKHKSNDYIPVICDYI